jgi:hypothetical protein
VSKPVHKDRLIAVLEEHVAAPSGRGTDGR